jgi:hypothetical protein
MIIGAPNHVTMGDPLEQYKPSSGVMNNVGPNSLTSKYQPAQMSTIFDTMRT